MVGMEVGQKDGGDIASLDASLRQPFYDTAAGIKQKNLWSRPDQCGRVHAVRRGSWNQKPTFWNRRTGPEECHDDCRWFALLRGRARDDRAKA
jgi:hypothetical protein